MTDVTGETRRAAPQGLVFFAIGGIVLIDVVMDLQEGTSPGHLVTEAAIFVLAAIGIAHFIKALTQNNLALHEKSIALARSLDAQKAEAAKWRKDAKALIDGLAAAIDSQLDDWKLSSAEKEVALLLLKGLTHKEVAEIRGTGEATARQQARSLYRKAGLSGRHDLAAFFLEDLLLPSSLQKPGAGAPAPSAL